VIDERGNVGDVQLLRPTDPSPPWPEIHTAGIAAIREWKYAPTTVKGKTVPVCMIVAINIDIR